MTQSHKATVAGASERSAGPPTKSSTLSGDSEAHAMASVGASPFSAGPPPASSASSARSQAHTMAGAGTHSLRWRLLGFVLAAILLGAALQAFTAYRSALRQADALFDEHLLQMARSLRSGIPPGFGLDSEEGGSGFDVEVQVWSADGRQIFRSSRSVLPPHAVLGFSDVQTNGSRYRVYSLQTPLQTVQIAQNLDERTRRARALALRAVLPFAWLTPLMLLAVCWAIQHSLAPIERTRRTVAARAADDLSPLADTGLPEEVRPLVDEINLLFGRVRSAFEAQKSFVADAAHELRSPLSALKLQAQALRRTAPGSAEHEAGMARLHQGIARAIRLVEQLLQLAREEAGAAQATSGATPVDLQQVVALAVGDVLPQAGLKRIDLGLAEPPAGAQAPQVSGQAEALRILLRNLLDNAIKYTPAGGQVDVSLQRDPESGQAVLTVEDSGPGIAPQDRARVFDRFYRASEASLETGSGLGLAIVKVIAERHGAALALGRSERLGGLQVQVRFAAGTSA